MPDGSLLTRRASGAPSSIDRQARTARLTAAAGADVVRQDVRGPFVERLPPTAADLSRLVGAPLLNAHRQGDLDAVLGVVRAAGFDERGLWVDVEFSERAQAIFDDVAKGIIRNVSAGYVIERATESIDPTTGDRIVTATRWVPHEVSLVALAADPAATVRGKEGPMPEPAVITPSPATTPAPPPLTTRGAVNAEIRSLGAGLVAQSVIDGLIDREATTDQARAAILDDIRHRSAVPIRTAVAPNLDTLDNPDFRVRAIGEALYCRINPSHSPSEPARPFVGLAMVELARDCLRFRGLSTTALSPATIVTRALHTTSDFPLILGDTVGRTLREAYKAAPAGVRQLARQTNVKDFRAKSRLMLGEMSTLEKVNEHGEFKSGTIAEAGESYKADSYGKVFGITRKAIINDDLGAFTDLSRRFGLSAAEFEAQFLVDLLISGSGAGPTMSDNVALFHANHGNKPASGAAISETTLSAARLAMRKQTGLSGKPIDVTPRFLLVPPDLETTATKQLAAVAAAEVFMVNAFAGALTTVVEPRLTNTTRWYLVADPATVDGLEYCYLEGEPGPQIETKAGFEVDGVQIKVRLDYGAGFVDWRAWYMNPGA